MAQPDLVPPKVVPVAVPRRTIKCAPLLLAVVALGACSSGVDPATGSEATVPAPGAGGTGVTTEGGTPVTSGATGVEVVQSPAAIEEYYQKLGVAQPVIDCYLEALDELGVTSLNQLEDDQTLGAEAADRFDGCVAEVGTAAVTTG